MIRFNCKKCNQRYKADDDLAGDEIECKKCGTAVHIPSMTPPVKKINLSIQKTVLEPKKTEGIKMLEYTVNNVSKRSFQSDKCHC